MRKVLGLLLIMASFIGTIFFSRYNGSIIPYPTLWYLSFLVLGLLGLWLIYDATRKAKKIVERHINSEVEKLKANAEKIEPDFDKCEFKNSSYTNEIIDERFSRFGTINLDYGKIVEKEFVPQSILIYHHTVNEKTEQFIQAFPCDADSLKVHVLKKNIVLYVNPFDRTKYFFELNTD